jgi:hypothetical protein
VLAGRGLVLVGDQGAAAEGRGAGDDYGQRQRLAGQGGRIGPDVLAEQEHAQQAGRQRVQDGEPGLGGGQRPGRQRVRGQQHGHRPGRDQHVQRPGGEDGAGAAAQVRAEFLDDRGHEPPRDPGGRPEHRGAAAPGRAGTTAEARRHGQRRGHDAGDDQPGQQPGGAGRVQPPAGRRGQAEEHADPGGHGRRGQQIAARHPPRPGDGQVTEDEQQLGGQDGLDQSQVAEAQRGDLEDEPADHGGDAEQPGWLAGQPDQQPGVKARRLGAPGALALAQRGGGRAPAGRDGQQDCLVHQRALSLGWSPPVAAVRDARGWAASRRVLLL